MWTSRWNTSYGPTPVDIPAGWPIDAWGNVVYPNQYQYVYSIQRIHGTPNYIYRTNPYYDPNWNLSSGSAGTGPAPVPPHYQITFDTIGQTIYRSIGHVRLPMRIIWAQGINASGTATTSSTITFAAALCAPLDPDETGEVAVIFSSSTAIYNTDGGGFIAPDGLSVEDAAALQLSLANAVLYPGDEAQLPAPLIVADKGSDVTNAFRGIRYIIFPLFPLAVANGLPSLSITWRRTNSISSAAVEFAAGAG